MPRPTTTSAGVWPSTVTAVFQNAIGPTSLNVGSCTSNLSQESPGGRPNIHGAGTLLGSIYMIGFFHLAGSAPTLAGTSVTLDGNTMPAFAAKVVVDTTQWQFSRVQIAADTVWTRTSGSLTGTDIPVSAQKVPLSFVTGEPFDASGAFIWN